MSERKNTTPVNDGGHYDRGYTGPASDAYRDGWDAIEWKPKPEPEEPKP